MCAVGTVRGMTDDGEVVAARPTLVICLALAYWLASAVGLSVAATKGLAGDHVDFAVFIGLLSVVPSLIGIGLWRGNRFAHAAAWAMCALVGLGGLARPLAGGLVYTAIAAVILIGLQQRDAKDWFGIR